MFQQQELTDRQLRYFGLSLAGLLFVFAGIAYWKWHFVAIAWSLGIAAVGLTAIYYCVPQSQRKIYNGFRRLTYPIQLVMSAIILGIVYYLVLTPIGFVLRLRGVSVRHKPTDSETFWNDRKQTSDAARYFDTF